MTLTPNTSNGRSAPHLSLLGLEPFRAALEYAGMHLMDSTGFAKGDGHCVVVFPGLASDRHATAPLTSFCERLGYDTFDWGRGFNTGPQGDPDEWLDALAVDVGNMANAPDCDLSLVGWSLGGIYAREIAKRLAPRVRTVITIGTPFAGGGDDTHAGLVYRLLNGQKPAMNEAMRKRLLAPPSAPTTSIFSRSDGVVAWEACVQPGHRVDVENVEVVGSHCGLGWNAEVLEVVADRLSQARGSWKPFASRRQGAIGVR